MLPTIRQRSQIYAAGAMLSLLSVFASASFAADELANQTIKHRLTGLCCLEREEDLRQVVATMPGVELKSIDFPNAEATFAYDAPKLFPQHKPEKFNEQFENLLRNASQGTFGIRPPATIPRDKLTLIEIKVVGLDCKACSFAAYEAIYKLPGVEQATASFKAGLVTAWIDPTQTNRAALEEALKKKGVELVPQE